MGEISVNLILAYDFTLSELDRPHSNWETTNEYLFES